MKIPDNSKFNGYSQVEYTNRNKEKSSGENNLNRGDKVELSGNIPKPDHNNQEVRFDEVARVKANVDAGKYKDPEVIEEIIDRLISKFGL